MRRMVEKLLVQYGMDITVEGRTVRGLLQPMTGRMERLALISPGAMGAEPRQRFVYIGPVSPQPAVDGELRAAGRRYAVRSSQHIYGGGSPLYTWAVCVEKGREDDGL